jgi:uncharacterized protein (TIGR03437 family)
VKIGFAFLLCASAALAQNPVQAFTCVANTGVPPVIRSEGITELVGDIVLQCAGGTPTPKGLPIPGVNVTVTLNTTITSPLLSNGASDPLLMIDEPHASAPIPSDAKPLQFSPPQLFCATPVTGCPVVGTGDGHPYDGQANVFQGILSGPNAVTWTGVPVDPQGGTGVRIIRITNVRANAAQLGTSSTLIPNKVIASISLSGSSILPLNNPIQAVAVVQASLATSVRTAPSFQQCAGVNQSAGTANFNVVANAVLNFRELFAQAFKRQEPGISADGTAAAPLYSQNVPGFIYNSESGFFDRTQGLPGAANFGSRLLLRFNNVGNGTGSGPFVLVPLFVPLSASGSSAPTTPPPPPAGVAPGVTNGFLRLISVTDVNGNGNGFNAIPQIPGSLNNRAMAETQYFPIPSSAGEAAAVYEVVNSDPSVIENGTIGIGIAFIGGTNAPPVGTTNVNLSFAPLSTVTPTSSQVIPRFVDQSATRFAGYTIYSCNQNASPLTVNNQTNPSVSLTSPTGSPNIKTLVLPITTSGPPIGNLAETLKINNGPGSNSNAPGREAAPVQQPWITANLSQTTTPSNLTLTIQPQGLAAGTYTATVTINGPTASNPSVSVPVTLVVAGTAPVITVAGITNSASNKTTSVTPGMMITIYGSNFGPGALNVQRMLENKGTLATLMSDTRVIFDGQYLAPMVYAAQGQISAMVPYEIAGEATTQIVVEYKGFESLPIIVPVTDAAPALFTADSSGSGQAAALNIDFSFNNSSNPVARGSFIQLFGTGEGLTTPAGMTGGVNTDATALPKPMLPVSASVGGIEVAPAYFGGLFGQLNGFFQVNLPIPDGAGTGNVPVVVRVNGKESPPVTISVK